MVRLGDFNTKEQPTWCLGCGNFGIWNALKGAMVKLNCQPHTTALVSGIGCSGKTPYWTRAYGFCGLHGRPLPVATGIKLANHKLNVIALGGDGDGYAEGMCHFIHACRRNLDITYIVHNNQIYGLTTGQTSPTSDQGFVTKSTPNGVIEEAVNPLTLSLSAGATFVSRGYAGDINHLTGLIIAGIRHRGFALIDVLQPCVTFNKLNTFQWFAKRVYKLKTPIKDKVKAFAKAREWGKKIPIGIFYMERKRLYEEEHLKQVNKDKPLVDYDISNIDISGLIEEFG